MNKLKLEGSSVMSPEFSVKVFPLIQTLDIDPKTMDLIMTPKSSYNWKVRGGPSRWEPTASPIIRLNNQQVSDLSSLLVNCNDKVETLSYTLKVVNQASPKLLRPQEVDAVLIINCQYPSEIRLVAPNTTLDHRSLYLAKP